MLERWLAVPAMDDPETTALHRQVVQSKPFLNAVYDDWDHLIVDRLPDETR